VEEEEEEGGLKERSPPASCGKDARTSRIICEVSLGRPGDTHRSYESPIRCVSGSFRSCFK
jgi:hypothetical protein